MYSQCRIQKDGIDLEKLETTLNDDSLKEPCDLKKALELVALLEAQLKDMSPNLDSISEYILFHGGLYSQSVTYMSDF